MHSQRPVSCTNCMIAAVTRVSSTSGQLLLLQDHLQWDPNMSIKILGWKVGWYIFLMDGTRGGLNQRRGVLKQFIERVLWR